jgi:sigma-B regulation protein RsbU (phosphoserine phosphatase)
VSEPTSLLLEMRFAARAEELQGVRDAVREQAASQGCGAECAGDIAMAVDEACQNIIRHGYRWDPEGTIELRMERIGQELVLFLADSAPTVDPARVKPRSLDEPRPGGIGTHLIRTVMDQAEFVKTSSERGNLLRMVKRIR